ncbi:hypothetical protein [Luteibacter yeojuensis]|uniref:Uncharacterized protein n=1 Tax=Luteibacter yeojuensis TaxID=345309 RepID=A0A7X5QVL6_9GAMM|nr:hypothetical protein [Luteibacter yeojuensis]NID16152.1 hypothetical protein [Luteibacter yeojuensis]
MAAMAALAAAGPAVGTNIADVDIDIVSQWQRERLENVGAVTALNRSTASIMRQILDDPASPYSGLRPSPDFMNDVDWASMLARTPTGAGTSENALAVLQWDLGATRARPDIDVPVGAATGYRDRFVAASTRKADVDADIFWHMLDLTGYRHSTRAAYYAVGMQILRAQILATAPDRRAAIGVDKELFDRVMLARHLGHLTSHDLTYLSTLVQHRLIHWRVGGMASTGLRQLPVAFRIARVAAAYRDAEGYFMAAPCQADASPADPATGEGQDDGTRDLCFVAATDRAVHRWYLDESRRQASYRPRQESSHRTSLIAAVMAVAFPLLEIASMVEVMEAAIADDMVTTEVLTVEEAEMVSERADLLTCRIPGMP